MKLWQWDVLSVIIVLVFSDKEIHHPCTHESPCKYGIQSEMHCTAYCVIEASTKALKCTENKRDTKLECTVKQEFQFYLQCEVKRLETAFMAFQLNKIGCFHRVTIEEGSREDFPERSRHRFSKFWLPPKLNVFVVCLNLTACFLAMGSPMEPFCTNAVFFIWFPLGNSRLHNQHLKWSGLHPIVEGSRLTWITFSPFLSQNTSSWSVALPVDDLWKFFSTCNTWNHRTTEFIWSTNKRDYFQLLTH